MTFALKIIYLRRLPIVISSSGAASSIIGGGANIHIFVFTDHKNNAEHEDMNIRPPPPIIELAAPLVVAASLNLTICVRV
jgi:hypothetical protein